ncbi:MAG: adenosylcobinamide-GDP ribazoletransferase [Hyphomicrobium sp.]
MSGVWSELAVLSRPWPRAFVAAVQFLTRIPVPRGGERSLDTVREDIARGLAFFPLVGALVGAITAVVLWMFDWLLPFPVAVLAALAVEARVTGALHEDAVADVCDAFGGGWTREDVLRILKDSRIGSYGALGLGLAVALRATGLMFVDGVAMAAFALVVSGAVGRLVILALMAAMLPVPGREGLAQDLGPRATWTTALAGAAIVSPVLVAWVWIDVAGAVTAILLLAGFVALFRRYLLARIGGLTGDCLGFAAYIGIVVATLAFAREG